MHDASIIIIAKYLINLLNKLNNFNSLVVILSNISDLSLQNTKAKMTCFLSIWKVIYEIILPIITFSFNTLIMLISKLISYNYFVAMFNYFLFKCSENVWKSMGKVFKLLWSDISKRDLSKESAPPYLLFGVYSLVNYVFPYFFWPDVYSGYPHVLFLKAIAAFLFFSLLFLDQFSKDRESKMFIYWCSVLTYCLPFISTYLLFLNKFHWFWIIHLFVSILILSFLVNSIRFILIFIIGTLVAVFFYFGFIFQESFYEEFKNILFPLGYVYTFTVIFGFIFSRRREQAEEKRLKTLEAMGGTIAHEMRTPLANILVEGVRMRNQVYRAKSIINDFCELKNSNFMSHIKELENISRNIIRLSNNSQKLINMLLISLMQDFEGIAFESLSMQEVIKNTLKNFPLNQKEKRKIHVEIKEDFYFKGDQELMMHVLFNLLKNSLYFIKVIDKGNIYITLRKGDTDNRLIFKDTGPGIDKSELPYLFKPFYSRRDHGTGIGLSFCKRTINSFKGKIKVESVIGKHTTFILIFPKDL